MRLPKWLTRWPALLISVGIPINGTPRRSRSWSKNCRCTSVTATGAVCRRCHGPCATTVSGRSGLCDICGAVTFELQHCGGHRAARCAAGRDAPESGKTAALPNHPLPVEINADAITAGRRTVRGDAWLVFTAH